MAFEHKEGTGTLFKNEKQNDRQPDYRGTIVIQGTTYEIAAWERTSQRGSSYLSLQASLPRDRQEQAPAQQPRPQYQAPKPQFQAPPVQQAPAPSADDFFAPAEDAVDDLPF